MQRFAKLKHVKLTVNPVEPPLAIYTDPFLFQLILVACLEYCMERTSGGGVITLQSRNLGKGIAIRIVIEAGTIHEEKSFALLVEPLGLHDALHDLRAQLLPIRMPGQQGLELILPLKAG